MLFIWKTQFFFTKKKKKKKIDNSGFVVSTANHENDMYTRAGIFRHERARTMTVPSRAELGNFNFRAETKLRFFQVMIKFSTSIMIITNSNQLHDYLYEFM